MCVDMKKIISVLLIIVVMFTLAGCGSNKKETYISTDKIVLFQNASDYTEFVDAKNINSDVGNAKLKELAEDNKIAIIPTGNTFEITGKKDDYYLVKILSSSLNDAVGVTISKQFDESTIKQ
jgi:hypothetical protein